MERLDGEWRGAGHHAEVRGFCRQVCCDWTEVQCTRHTEYLPGRRQPYPWCRSACPTGKPAERACQVSLTRSDKKPPSGGFLFLWHRAIRIQLSLAARSHHEQVCTGERIESPLCAEGSGAG